MKAVCQLIVLVLLATLVLAVLGVAVFIGLGALLSHWLPLSLFHASTLAVVATIAMALVILAVTMMMRFQMDNTVGDDDLGWEPIEEDDSHTSIAAPRVPTVPRNQPCPCGSGKKFKNCCGTSAAP